MKRLLKRFSVIMTAVLMMAAVMTPQVFAAASVSMSGGDSVEGGDTFYVAVTFGGGDVGRVDAQITYDTSKLTYISGGTSTGDAGYINLSKAGTGGSVTFNIKFQALTDGSTTLKLTTFDLYDLDEMPMNEYPSATKTISISGNAGNDEVITQETSPEEPEEPTELMGVDEMEEEGGANITLILIISAVVLAALIIIIIVVLSKKKRKAPSPAARIRHEEPEPKYDSYQDDIRGNFNNNNYDDKGWLDELMGSGNVDRKNDRSKTYRKRAKEETEVFSDWNIPENDNDDIDKW